MVCLRRLLRAAAHVAAWFEPCPVAVYLVSLMKVSNSVVSLSVNLRMQQRHHPLPDQP
jgi:hypothetical protein